MTVKELVEKLRLTVYNMANECNAEGVWCGDLLSHVMVNAPEKCAWITVMTNVNVAAVAKLRAERIKQQRPLTKTARVLLIIGSVTFTLSIIVSFWEPLYGLSLVFRLTWFVLLAIVALKHFPWK